MDTNLNIRSRFKGMFWGLVIGDCLGSPIQFTEKDQHPYITDMQACADFNTPPGYWTDDSSISFCIAESFLRLRRYDLKDIANNFVRWYDNGFCSSLAYSFDIGAATSEACRMIRERGCLANGLEDSQGNGSIMRFAPAYIMNYGKKDNKILYEISDITHKSTVIHRVIDKMTLVLDEHMQGCRTSIESPYKARNDVNNSGWAVSTLDAALWAFHSSRTFEEGMIAAVNLGGDADSIGAVFGQIAGAFYGYESIPERWLIKIKDRDKVNHLIDDFIDLFVAADSCIPHSHVKKVNLLDEPADALIYSTNILLNMTGGVGAQLLHRYGSSLQKELHAFLKTKAQHVMSRGDILDFKLPSMPWKKVFHTLPCDAMYHTNPEIVGDIIKRCLRICLQSGSIKKVAMSALGTGYGDLSMDEFISVFNSISNSEEFKNIELILCLPPDDFDSL